jgi:hypothetical protein
MTMKVIGVGLGRTGTHSLKTAINQLGIGPCHHMDQVFQNLPAQVPLWSAATAGTADWSAIYDGYSSAVDWPTAGFFSELHDAYPSAKFVLTERNPETWADSFQETIYTLLAGKDKAPPEMHPWLDMANSVIAKSGFAPGLERDDLIKGFIAHNEMVKKTIPAEQLLVFAVKDGWEPLCTFLGEPIPDEPFPRTNDRLEFWDRVNGKT